MCIRDRVCLTKEQIAEAGADGTDLEGITGIPRAIEGVKVGITMRQQPTGSYKAVSYTHLGRSAHHAGLKAGRAKG